MEVKVECEFGASHIDWWPSVIGVLGSIGNVLSLPHTDCSALLQVK